MVVIKHWQNIDDHFINYIDDWIGECLALYVCTLELGINFHSFYLRNFLVFSLQSFFVYLVNVTAKWKFYYVIFKNKAYNTQVLIKSFKANLLNWFFHHNHFMLVVLLNCLQFLGYFGNEWLVCLCVFLATVYIKANRMQKAIFLLIYYTI